jgi:hypothetical protein
VGWLGEENERRGGHGPRGDLGLKAKGFHLFPFKFLFEVSHRFKFKLCLHKTKI